MEFEKMEPMALILKIFCWRRCHPVSNILFCIDRKYVEFYSQPAILIPHHKMKPKTDKKFSSLQALASCSSNAGAFQVKHTVFDHSRRTITHSEFALFLLEFLTNIPLVGNSKILIYLWVTVGTSSNFIARTGTGPILWAIRYGPYGMDHTVWLGWIPGLGIDITFFYSRIFYFKKL